MSIYARIVRDGLWLCESEVTNGNDYNWLRLRSDDSIPCGIVNGIGKLNGSEMSLFLLEGEEYLDRLAAAWLSNKSDNNFKLAYVDKERIDSLGINIEKEAARTMDEGINECHRSLGKMTVEELNKVINVLYRSKIKLYQEIMVDRSVEHSIKNGWIKKKKCLKKKYKALFKAKI